ncbi:hypothetical protein EYF80_003893 [Liparis tanakae]|uniref:Uncharacterized protein n=1 Tax=Liparis tanakae TaxID=230148 RepID=A0A4Z2J777_9TELE|nr:hypothetical protein EYF80_003893 [Liparis tanakae]
MNRQFSLWPDQFTSERRRGTKTFRLWSHDSLVSTVHIGSATHGQKAGDRGRVDDNVHGNFAFVGCIQQVSKDIHEMLSGQPRSNSATEPSDRSGQYWSDTSPSPPKSPDPGVRFPGPGVSGFWWCSSCPGR